MTTSNGVRAVLFDFGGTLGYDEPGFAEGFATLVSAMGYPADRQRYHEAGEKARERLPEAPREVGPWLVWRKDYHRQIIRLLGVPDDDLERVAQTVAERLRYYTRAYAYPDSPYTLRCLRKAGYVVGVISNIAPALPLVLDELGLSRHLHFAIASETFGAEKPDRRIFEEGLRQAGVAAHQAMYVGDSIEADVMGAAPLGIHPVLIDRSGTVQHREGELRDRYGALRITNLTQLLDHLGVQLWADEALHDVAPSR